MRCRSIPSVAVTSIKIIFEGCLLALASLRLLWQKLRANCERPVYSLETAQLAQLPVRLSPRLRRDTCGQTQLFIPSWVSANRQRWAAPAAKVRGAASLLHPHTLRHDILPAAFVERLVAWAWVLQWTSQRMATGLAGTSEPQGNLRGIMPRDEAPGGMPRVKLVLLGDSVSGLWPSLVSGRI